MSIDTSGARGLPCGYGSEKMPKKKIEEYYVGIQLKKRFGI